MKRHHVLALLTAAVLTLAGSALPAGASDGAPAAAADPASITGRVVRGTGDGVPGAAVVLHLSIGGPFWVYTSDWTDGSGAFSVSGLPVGTYRLYINAHDPELAPEYYDDQPAFATATDIVVTEGSAVTVPDITLDPAAHVTGAVTGAGGPLEGVVVRALARASSGDGWVVAGEAASGRDGHYDVGGLPAGSYRIAFLADAPLVSEWFDGAYRVEDADDVTVTKSQVRENVDACLDEGSHITGTVTNVDGAPLPGIRVNVYELRDGSWELLGMGTTGGPGTYDVAGLHAGSYRVGFLDPLSVYAREYYDDQDWVDAGDPVDVGPVSTTPGIDAQLAVAGHVSGRVTSTNGKAVRDGQVTVYRLDHGTFTRYGADETDANGDYTVGGLPRGTYRVQFEDPAWEVTEFWNDKGSLQAADDLQLVSGQSREGLDAVLDPALGALAVKNLAAPVLSATPRVGVPLTVDPGRWSPAGVTLSLQWSVGSHEVYGATGTTYTPGPADLGRTIRVAVRATRTGWWPAAATTAASAEVAAGALALVKAPKLRGQLRVGARLKVTAGSWSPVPVTVRYRWFVGSKLVAFGARSRFHLTREMLGKRVSVKVTASAEGYEPHTTVLRGHGLVRG